MSIEQGECLGVGACRRRESVIFMYENRITKAIKIA
jgi:hypothetical protein